MNAARSPEASGDEMRLDQVFRHVGQAESGQCRVEHLAGAIEDELAIDADLQCAPAFLELPRIQSAARRQAQIDAIVTSQLLRILRQ